jgi:hypothetical protein
MVYDYQYYRSKGQGYMSLALVLLAMSVIFLLLSDSSDGVFFLTLIVLVFGHKAFNNLEQAEKLKPIPPVPPEPIPEPPDVHEKGVISAFFNTGVEVTVHIEVIFLRAEANSQTLDRIETGVQRAISSYLCQRQEFASTDPYHELDSVLETKLRSLKEEIGLSKLFVRTVDIQPPNIPLPTRPQKNDAAADAPSPA